MLFFVDYVVYNVALAIVIIVTCCCCDSSHHGDILVLGKCMIVWCVGVAEYEVWFVMLFLVFNMLLLMLL